MLASLYASMYGVNQEVIDSARSVLEAYNDRSEAGKERTVQEHAGFAGLLRSQLGKMQMAGIRGACSRQCLCADYSSTMWQLVSACSKAAYAAGADGEEKSRIQGLIFRGLPAMAAQLLDPASGHRLDAVQDALQVFRQ
jgi:hypothetical protein